MKKLVSAILALLLAVIMVGGGVLPPAAPVAATGVQVSLSAPANVLLGSNFTATVNITNVVDLNGAQYEIVVDPAVLVVDNVTAGQIGATVIPVQGFTMVSPGRYLVLQSLMFDTVNGTGYLAVVHLRAVGSAGSSSAINLANGILSGWTAEIPATWVGGSVNIYQVATQLASITVTPINPSVAAGLTQQFTATGNYTDAHTADITNTVAWASSDTAVATINATSGLATGKAVGTTVITATSGNISGSTTLTVTAAELVFMQVMPGWQQIPLGLAQQYSAIGFYTDGSTVNMTSLVDWVSSNTSVATVGLHTGLAKTLAQGTTWISATLGNAYGGS
ncbi:MAG: Ig-like domain-containing protein, partial [Chloroflexi bacterium]|nr:Ig-like domain-containing protein [Chloroflexota bacterium]